MHSRIQAFAVGLAAVAVTPYIVLKLLWLGGSTIGLKNDAAITELHSTRMVIGNCITIVLELLAVGLAFALTQPWGRRAPGWIVVILAAGATGLLAPILLGLPLGSALQLLLHGDVRTGGMDNMDPWVFAAVYGGFGLLAISIAILGWRYVSHRWGHFLSCPPAVPARWCTFLGAIGMLPFGAAMLWWGAAGPGSSGPQEMDAIAQRTTLMITGLLVVAGFLVPLLRTTVARWPGPAWLATWVGCTAAALQAPTEVLLAGGGHPTTAIQLLALVTTPGAVVYGLAILRRRLVAVTSVDPQCATRVVRLQRAPKPVS